MHWAGWRYLYEDGSPTTGAVAIGSLGYGATFKGKSLQWFGNFAEAKAAVETAWRDDREGTSQ